MSENSKLNPIPNEYALDFEYHHKETNKWYRGSFVVKRPTIRDRQQFRLRAIQYCNGRYYDEEKPGHGVDYVTWITAMTISRLELCFSSYDAPWFDKDNLWNFGELDVLFNLWEEVAGLDASIFRGKPRKRGQFENEGAVEYSGAVSGNVVTKMVDREVPTANNI